MKLSPAVPQSSAAACRPTRTQEKTSVRRYPSHTHFPKWTAPTVCAAPMHSECDVVCLHGSGSHSGDCYVIPAFKHRNKTISMKACGISRANYHMVSKQHVASVKRRLPCIKQPFPVHSTNMYCKIKGSTLRPTQKVLHLTLPWQSQHL